MKNELVDISWYLVSQLNQFTIDQSEIQRMLIDSWIEYVQDQEYCKTIDELIEALSNIVYTNVECSDIIESIVDDLYLNNEG